MEDIHFVSNDKNSQKKLREHIEEVMNALEKNFWNNKKAYNKLELSSDFKIPLEGEDLNKIIEEVGSKIISSSVNLSHSKSAAYLHSLPTMASTVAELIIGATNQTLDSWEESPSATVVEQGVVKFFCNLVGYGTNSDGIIDAGGTMANQSAVLISRDWFISKSMGIESKKQGIPPDLISKLKIFCSEESHFTIEKSAAICGLGTDSVIKVPVNSELVMDVVELEKRLNYEIEKGNKPFLIVATAGKTNSGNIPNLKKIGEIAKKNNIWYHVDAAYGGGLLFSKKYRTLLDGIETADSITMDPHKLLYQSVSCGLFLLADGKNFKDLTYHSEYLNPESDKETGVINLVDKSLQTTKRFDALKLYMSLRHLGIDGYDQLITKIMDKTKQFASIIKEDKDFELFVEPQTGILLFRYVGVGSEDTNKLNDDIQKGLYANGKSIINRTKIGSKTLLKISTMNPLTNETDFRDILADIKSMARS
jgi:L-2,4-diaminobutyrate decarboxylase